MNLTDLMREALGDAGPLELGLIEQDDGTVVIEWDENSPAAIALGVSEWTDEQWQALLAEAAQQAEQRRADE